MYEISETEFLVKKNILLALSLLVSATVSAEDIKIDLEQLAQQYFDTMVATQAPGATKVELENHLNLLADDVGHSHLPWVIDDTRFPLKRLRTVSGISNQFGSSKTLRVLFSLMLDSRDVVFRAIVFSFLIHA